MAVWGEGNNFTGNPYEGQANPYGGTARTGILIPTFARSGNTFMRGGKGNTTFGNQVAAITAGTDPLRTTWGLPGGTQTPESKEAVWKAYLASLPQYLQDYEVGQRAAREAAYEGINANIGGGLRWAEYLAGVDTDRNYQMAPARSALRNPTFQSFRTRGSY